ncbi:hypothetical protein PG993_012864 [Apiospora rasikravindrae]|uniref:Uncharacterized protein n=1 Tax=Apiospora rasikravindrae TaxID=990691 RepID=A0ABR1RW00_9PEZI
MAELLSYDNTHAYVSAEEDVGGVSQRTQSFFIGALEAMSQWDTRRLIIYLRRIVSLPTAELQHVIERLPRNTISEFLQSLDPKRVAPDNDPTDGARISVGMYHLLGLGQHMDSYGTRKLFARLLVRMNVLVQCAHNAGMVLGAEDYISLFRAYGAISDIAGAKQLWDQAFGAVQRQPGPEVLHEFLKVRFLVDPMYHGFDKVRVAVTPRNLHRRGYLRFHQSVRRLDRLRFNRQQKAFKFGLDRSMPTAMSLTRRMRGNGPITRLFNSWIARRNPMTEEVLCSFMIGFARAGSLRFVGLKILPAYFGILTKKDKATGEITTNSLTPTLSNGVKRPQHKYRFMWPTSRLLNTIVEAFCSNGQMGWALDLLDFISREYQVPIPAETWFDLLEWSHVLSSTPVATAWKMAGWYQQIPARDATELVWNTMTQEPYNVQPGFDQYAVLLRSRISRGQFLRADDKAMAKLRQLYDDQSARYETSVFEYIGAVRDGVTPITGFLIAYQRARFRKQHMWFALSEICKRNLADLRPTHLADARAVRDVPDFVWRNERFVENATAYRLATGFVSLADPARPMRMRLYKGRRGRLDVPLKMKGTWRLVRTRPRRSPVLSSRALAEFKNTRLDPLPLLSGALDAFRLPAPRTSGELYELKNTKKQVAKRSRVQRSREQKLARKLEPQETKKRVAKGPSSMESGTEAGTEA